MDQSAFRAMMASGSGSASSRSSSTPSAALGGGSRKRHHETSAAGSSLGQFKPRGQQKLPGSVGNKGKEREESKEKDKEKDGGVPSYRRFGYTDRASMRRAGIAEGEEGLMAGEKEDEQAEGERRPRGLDMAQLAASKRALLLGEDYAAEEEERQREPSGPPKTEEEIERELEEAAQSMKQQEGDDEQSSTAPKPYAKNQREAEQPPAKKQKRSRADMLRDLQAKIASASGGNIAPGAVTDTSEPGAGVERKKKSTNGVASLPTAMKGFKAIEKAPEKKKKKKKPKEDPEGVTAIHPEQLSTSGPKDPLKAVDTSAAKNTVLHTGAAAGDELDDDFDIFAGAGDYEDEFGEDDAVGDGDARDADMPLDPEDKAEREKVPYFEDQEDLIPKFQAYRSPTPPPRGEPGIEREAGEDNQAEFNHRFGSGDADAEDTASPKPKRLEGFSTSNFTARDLLDYDDAQAREEKRKLKKLKGKEKKEAMEREEQFEASRTAEQKEKDKLNREVQEYEKYERKKQAKTTGAA